VFGKKKRQSPEGGTSPQRGLSGLGDTSGGGGRSCTRKGQRKKGRGGQTRRFHVGKATGEKKTYREGSRGKKRIPDKAPKNPIQKNRRPLRGGGDDFAKSEKDHKKAGRTQRERKETCCGFRRLRGGKEELSFKKNRGGVLEKVLSLDLL